MPPLPPTLGVHPVNARAVAATTARTDIRTTRIRPPSASPRSKIARRETSPLWTLRGHYLSQVGLMCTEIFKKVLQSFPNETDNPPSWGDRRWPHTRRKPCRNGGCGASETRTSPPWVSASEIPRRRSPSPRWTHRNLSNMRPGDIDHRSRVHTPRDGDHEALESRGFPLQLARDATQAGPRSGAHPATLGGRWNRLRCR